MKPPHPKFPHRALNLLETLPQTPTTFKQIHSHLTTTGLAAHTYPLSRLLLHSSLLSLSYSLSLLFHHSSFPSTFLFNTLISSLSSQPHTLPLALSLYSLLLPPLSPSKPNPHTYPSLLKAAAASASHPCLGLALHAHIIKFALPDDDPFLLSALLTFYSKFRKLSLSRLFFDRLPDPDLPIWNSILTAYSSSSSNDASASTETLLLFQSMQRSPTCRPNEISLVALIGACGDLGALTQGVWAHTYVIRKGLAINRFVGTALVELYSKCGRLDLAQQVFAGLPHRDTLCYNAMIRGLAIHGCGRRAVLLFDRMRNEGVRVDDVTLLVVMSACARSGLIDEGRKCFDRMEKDFGITPKAEHYGCLVDLLGRAGRLEEAEKEVRQMPMKPNAALYRSLLGACRLHRKLEIGERVMVCLMELEKDHGGNYVLLSNMYADVNRWDDVRRVRKAMKDEGIDKTPGSSLVEMDGVVHEFIMGDKNHPRSKEIYTMLDEMGRRLHECGHQPRTKEVLFDMEEEDKEDALSYHSERLAIAFALIASASGSPIRIIKNLRVCEDCHSSTKLISWIYRREIIVRDRIRFHHFKDGSCSCLDYW